MRRYFLFFLPLFVIVIVVVVIVVVVAAAAVDAVAMVTGNKADRLTFETLSGPLVAVREGNFISMDFPLNDPHPLQVHIR